MYYFHKEWSVTTNLLLFLSDSSNTVCELINTRDFTTILICCLSQVLLLWLFVIKLWAENMFSLGTVNQYQNSLAAPTKQKALNAQSSNITRCVLQLRKNQQKTYNHTCLLSEKVRLLLPANIFFHHIWYNWKNPSQVQNQPSRRLCESALWMSV